jgi:hypothetical protein
MSRTTIKTRLADALSSFVIRHSSVAPRAKQAFPLAFGSDPGLYGFRRLTNYGSEQATLRDLPLPTHERMQELAYYLYLTNDMANWWINTQMAYITGEGIKLQAEDPQTQVALDAFWTDPVNDWPLKLPNKVRELSLYGEQCWPAFVAEGTGRVRLGYLDPCLLQEVVLDPDNAEQAIGIITKSQTGYFNLPSRRYRTILAIPEEELTPSAQRLRQDFSDGDCFYFAVNKVSNGSRGWSDLLAKVDWFDGYEQFLFQRLERSDLANRVVYDLQLAGFTQEQITEFMKSFQLPKPGGVHAHNEKVTLDVKSPDLKAMDATVDARLFRNHCLSPLPEHWYGGGGDINRATAGEMDEPTFKHFAARQLLWKAIIEKTCRFALRSQKAAGLLAQGADETFQTTFPEMVTADLSKLGAVALQVAQSVAAMLLQGTITKAEGRQLFSVVSKSFGVELPDMTDEELAAAADRQQFQDASQDYPPGKKPATDATMQQTRLRAL